MDKLMKLHDDHIIMAEVCNMLDNWLEDGIDRGDTTQNNYEAFLELTAQDGYRMPVDEDPYFDFWNEIYLIIDAAIIQHNA